MAGTDFRTRRSAAAGKRQSVFIAFLLCLAMLLPALPVRPAVAGPDSVPATSLRARQPDQPLIAFLRQGNLWLMNGDGSDQRQITISEGGVQRFSWSPSGQYIVILHESRLDLYDVANGEMRRLIEMPNGTPYPQGRFPSWAVDADELLMEVSEGDATYAIVRIGLDGTSTPVSSYTQRQPCAGPSGAMTIMIDLLWLKELGSPFARDSYQDMVWWSDRDIAYINPFCATGVALDLTTGTMSEYPETVWLDGSPDGRLLIQGYPLVGGDSAAIFDPATGTTTHVDGGEVLAWSPTGEIVTTTVTRGPESAFSSRFDDVSGGYTDNTIEMWRSDSQGGNRQLVATLDIQGTGIPSVASDGAIIVGAVDNPTELMDVDESQFSEYSPEIYAEHQKILRIDPDGEVTVLLTNAYRPRLQPVSGASVAAGSPSDKEEPTDLTGTPEPTAAPTEVAEQSVPTGGDGWIAYAGRDGNIWLSRPDGSVQRQVTTDGSPDRPYIHPNWSPDGTMLVFSTRNGQEETGNDIYLLRDGAVTRVPSIHNCSSAAFTADGARLALLCASGPRQGTPSQDSLDIDPSRGFVSVVDFDGSNWRVLTPFELEMNGSNTLWWDKLATYDIDVSAADGEILVNSIFFSSARSRGISLISPEGAWDAQFSTPPDERGRIWGRFDAEGTSVLTRICRGCYKDSPGPPNAAILLLDRDGNVIETLYTPDADALIDGFAQSPDVSRLLVSSTTEETDFDFGTPGLIYTTQMVDIASGVVTDVSIDGGDFAWQPAAVDIAVPESTAGLQPTTQFISTAPVVAIACTTTSEGFLLSAETLNLPEGCAVAEGMRFTVSGANGEPYGQCVIGSAAYCSQPEIWMPVDVEVTVTVDTSTIPAGYAVVGGNSQKFTFESKYLNTDALQWLIVLMPVDVATSQEMDPTEPATEVAMESGSASGLVIEPGRDWIAYVGEDGNIWLMQPDGSQQTQVTTDGGSEHGVSSYDMPAWSHDGTMLTFMGYGYTDENGGIWVLRDGILTLLPNTDAPCFGPAFSADDQRVLYTCAQNASPGEPVPADLATNPLRGFVTSSALDGSDQRIEVLYSLDGSGIDWTSDGKAAHNGRRVDVRPSDGAIMVVYSGFHKAGVHLFASDGTLTHSFDLYQDGVGSLGPYDAHFIPDGQGIIAAVCTYGCFPAEETQTHDILVLDLDGNIVESWSASPQDRGFSGVDMAPDGSRVVVAERVEGSSGAAIVVFQAPMQPVTIGPGSAPAWQPNPDAAASGDAVEQASDASGEAATAAATSAATSAPTTVATAPAETAETGSGLRIEPESDWIAYEGDDSNIWLMQPDGSQQVQVTTDGTQEAPYVWPTWSHDGTMLVFARRPSFDSGESATIHILRDGAVSQVPNVHGCRAAAFMPGDQQLVLGCGSDFPASGASDSAMQTDPSLGFVSMANLDGSDWHVAVPYHRASDGVWPNHAGGPDMAWVESMSVHPDGTILLSFSGFHGHGLALLEAGSTTPVVQRSPLGRGGVVGRFFHGSDEILIGACKGCYPRANSGDPEVTIAWMDRGGAITTTLYVPDSLQEMGMPTISPDGGTLVFSTNRSIQSLDLNTGSQVTIGAGTAVAWQPNASVAMARPASPVTSGAVSPSGSTTTPATAGQQAPAQAASGAVPSQFVATWSGRGVQENPYGEWAVTIAITGGGIGEIVGTSEYPEESCGGNLILQEVTADAIVMREQLTYGEGTCADGGTITLAGIDGVNCQFAWSGIGPYGTPSSAGGTLSRPDGATTSPDPEPAGAVAPSGDQSYGPAQDTTQLHPDYIGTYAGTGNQKNPDATWPITVTFTGGRPGEVIGTVEYPTLGCGGELILVSINPVDEWRGFQVTERITYGHENCIDGGTFGFSQAESGIGITFSWRSPVSATRASGHLPEVESGTAAAPAEQPTGASDGGSEVEPAGEDATGDGPPSIYDDPEAEPVPIEAEGG